MLVALRPALHGALLDAVGPETITLGARVDGFSASGGAVALQREWLHRPRRPAGRCRWRAVDHSTAAAPRRSRRHVTAASSPCAEPSTARSSTLATCTPSTTWAPASNPCLCGPAIPASTGFFRWRRASHRPALRIRPQWSAAWRRNSMTRSARLRRPPTTCGTTSWSIAIRSRWWGSGVVTLLGDAAHPLLPHTGQGAAQAIVDAVTLGKAVRNSTNLEASLRAYERERIPKAATLLAQGRRTARVMATTNPVACYLRELFARAIPMTTFARIFVRINRQAGTDIRSQ